MGNKRGVVGHPHRFRYCAVARINPPRRQPRGSAGHWGSKPRTGAGCELLLSIGFGLVGSFVSEAAREVHARAGGFRDGVPSTILVGNRMHVHRLRSWWRGRGRVSSAGGPDSGGGSSGESDDDDRWNSDSSVVWLVVVTSREVPADEADEFLRAVASGLTAGGRFADALFGQHPGQEPLASPLLPLRPAHPIVVDAFVRHALPRAATANNIQPGTVDAASGRKATGGPKGATPGHPTLISKGLTVVAGHGGERGELMRLELGSGGWGGGGGGGPAVQGGVKVSDVVRRCQDLARQCHMVTLRPRSGGYVQQDQRLPANHHATKTRGRGHQGRGGVVSDLELSGPSPRAPSDAVSLASPSLPSSWDGSHAGSRASMSEASMVSDAHSLLPTTVATASAGSDATDARGGLLEGAAGLVNVLSRVAALARNIQPGQQTIDAQDLITVIGSKVEEAAALVAFAAGSTAATPSLLREKMAIVADDLGRLCDLGVPGWAGGGVAPHDGFSRYRPVRHARHERLTSSRLIGHPVARHFWSTNFGDETFVVGVERYCDALHSLVKPGNDLLDGVIRDDAFLLMARYLDCSLTDVVHIVEFDKLTRSMGIFGSMLVLVEGHHKFVPLDSVERQVERAAEGDDGVIARTVLIKGVDVSSVVAPQSFSPLQAWIAETGTLHRVVPWDGQSGVGSRVARSTHVTDGEEQRALASSTRRSHASDATGSAASARTCAPDGAMGVVCEFSAQDFDFGSMATSDYRPELTCRGSRRVEVVFPSPVTVDAVLGARTGRNKHGLQAPQQISETAVLVLQLFASKEAELNDEAELYKEIGSLTARLRDSIRGKDAAAREGRQAIASSQSANHFTAHPQHQHHHHQHNREGGHFFEQNLQLAERVAVEGYAEASIGLADEFEERRKTHEATQEGLSVRLPINGFALLTQVFGNLQDLSVKVLRSTEVIAAFDCALYPLLAPGQLTATRTSFRFFIHTINGTMVKHVDVADVIALRRSNVLFGSLPDAIEVLTGTETLRFEKFGAHRERAFRLLRELWAVQAGFLGRSSELHSGWCMCRAGDAVVGGILAAATGGRDKGRYVQITDQCFIVGAGPRCSFYDTDDVIPTGEIRSVERTSAGLSVSGFFFKDKSHQVRVTSSLEAPFSHGGCVLVLALDTASAADVWYSHLRRAQEKAGSLRHLTFNVLMRVGPSGIGQRGRDRVLEVRNKIMGFGSITGTKAGNGSSDALSKHMLQVDFVSGLLRIHGPLRRFVAFGRVMGVERGFHNSISLQYRGEGVEVHSLGFFVGSDREFTALHMILSEVAREGDAFQLPNHLKDKLAPIKAGRVEYKSSRSFRFISRWIEVMPFGDIVVSDGPQTSMPFHIMNIVGANIIPHDNCLDVFFGVDHSHERYRFTTDAERDVWYGIFTEVSSMVQRGGLGLPSAPPRERTALVEPGGIVESNQYPASAGSALLSSRVLSSARSATLRLKASLSSSQASSGRHTSRSHRSSVGSVSSSDEDDGQSEGGDSEDELSIGSGGSSDDSDNSAASSEGGSSTHTDLTDYSAEGSLSDGD